MQDPTLKTIVPGSPYPNRAEHWNSLVDSTKKVESLYQQSQTDDPSFEDLQNAILVECDFRRGTGEYVILEDVVTDPAVAEGVFRVSPIPKTIQSEWTSNTSNNQWGRLAIMAQDTAPGTINYAYVTGTAIARIQRTYAYHDHADINPDNGFVNNGITEMPLRTHPSGSWQILWDDAVPSLVSDPQPGWAILRHCGIWQRELKCQVPSDGELLPGTSNLVNVSWGGQPADDTKQIMVTHDWFDQLGNPIGADSKILAKWFPDQLQWVVVAAEC